MKIQSNPGLQFTLLFSSLQMETSYSVLCKSTIIMLELLNWMQLNLWQNIICQRFNCIKLTATIILIYCFYTTLFVTVYFPIFIAWFCEKDPCVLQHLLPFLNRTVDRPSKLSKYLFHHLTHTLMMIWHESCKLLWNVLIIKHMTYDLWDLSSAVTVLKQDLALCHAKNTQ